MQEVRLGFIFFRPGFMFFFIFDFEFYFICSDNKDGTEDVSKTEEENYPVDKLKDVDEPIADASNDEKVKHHVEKVKQLVEKVKHHDEKVKYHDEKSKIMMRKSSIMLRRLSIKMGWERHPLKRKPRMMLMLKKTA